MGMALILVVSNGLGDYMSLLLLGWIYVSDTVCLFTIEASGPNTSGAGVRFGRAHAQAQPSTGPVSPP